ncbi:MAG: phage tail sheath family protein [Cytophagales bacterium]|nr:MAG: phage tail sheath family protein [Cytophagales bacterium]TAF61126.1 MAG: phage tail sheath family protein [Cytophagales bacterium]
MAQRLATPGVYIEEKNAFSNSVVGLPTSVPAFIGYTEIASKGGKSVLNRAVRITSLAEYHTYFGGGPTAKFSIQPTTGADFDLEVGKDRYQLEQTADTRFMLYNAMRLFFDNGGGLCYVLSVGHYTKPDGSANVVEFTPMKEALNILIAEEEPTLLLAPEAVLLEAEDCYSLYKLMLSHCGDKMKNRFAVLDVHSGFNKRSYDEEDVVLGFRNGVGANFLNYGAGYYPWIHTTIVQANELDYRNIANLDVLESILSAEVDLLTDESKPMEVKKAEEIKAVIKQISDEDSNANTLNQTLMAVCPSLKTILSQVRGQLNILPPSAAMVGIYSMVDNARGVWKAPANVSLSSVVAPAVNITGDDQEDLNVTITGKSVNAIRPFIGEGVIVWGARTLDGNSQDWRYINVRRTLIYIEQSIKYAAKAYVFEPNTAGTWLNIKSMLNNFLNELWKQGGLVGATPDQAFEVAVGIGSTMTPNDVLDGIMRISVKVAISRPAEFIVVTFQQKMQES